MKRVMLILLVALLGVNQNIYSQNTKYSFPTESLNYQIVYHWGIIWKHAASATLTSYSSGNNFNARMSAQTISWADKIYRVRDTLYSAIDKTTFRPIRYIKSSHEGKYYGKDIIHYSHNNSQTTANTYLYRKDKPVTHNILSSNGEAYDMLSVFYYLRSLNFPSLNKNTVYQVIVFSGKRKEKLNIRYVGIETIKLRDKSQHQAYHIKFSFTQDSQKKSSDDLDTWISTDNRRIPLMIRGKLPIGEVRCYYSSK